MPGTEVRYGRSIHIPELLPSQLHLLYHRRSQLPAEIHAKVPEVATVPVRLHTPQNHLILKLDLYLFKIELLWTRCLCSGRLHRLVCQSTVPSTLLDQYPDLDGFHSLLDIQQVVLEFLSFD